MSYWFAVCFQNAVLTEDNPAKLSCPSTKRRYCFKRTLWSGKPLNHAPPPPLRATNKAKCLINWGCWRRRRRCVLEITIASCRVAFLIFRHFISRTASSAAAKQRRLRRRLLPQRTMRLRWVDELDSLLEFCPSLKASKALLRLDRERVAGAL